MPAAPPPPPSLPPVLPIGTAVVTLTEVRTGPTPHSSHPKGAAAVVVAAPVDPDHAYRVRFPGGDEVSLHRRDFDVLTHFHAAHPSTFDPLARHDLAQHVVYRCVIGSRAYGLARDGSDTDRRGIYLPPASMHWSVYGVPEQLENPDTQECYWELEKFLRLALKANPNVLEALHSPLVEHLHPIAAPFREHRRLFLSKLIYQTFSGYAMSQFKKMEQDLRTTGGVKWKHAMHLIRLLHAGIDTLTTGELTVDVGGRRQELLEIRDGLLPWAAVDALRIDLHTRFEAAFTASRLPDRPDYERVNALLIEARAEMARREFPPPPPHKAPEVLNP